MKKKSIIGLSVVIICLLGILILVYYDNKNKAPGEYDDFAKCLAEKGLKMYGTEWCSHCKNQKARFGNSFQYVDYIDCDKNKATCIAEGINGYPTWKFNNQAYEGEKELSELAQIAGCEL